jgi:hypothetical protein
MSQVLQVMGQVEHNAQPGFPFPVIESISQSQLNAPVVRR